MTGLTTWERWKAGQPARDKDERDRYREYAAVTHIGYPEPDRGPLQVLSSPKPQTAITAVLTQSRPACECSGWPHAPWCLRSRKSRKEATS